VNHAADTLVWWQAVLLGLVQGLTEFLPVSSSGHLALAEAFFRVPGAGVAFAVLLHAGTLLAIFFVFPDGIRRLVLGFFAAARSPWRPPPAARLFFHVVIATIPGGLVGLFLEDRIEAAFANPAAVGSLLLVTALILFSTRRTGPGTGEITWKIALIIGCAQAFAILPGISRSGTTIATALLLGIARPSAAEFSFLASMPLILGSLVLELPELRESSLSGGLLPLVAGFLTAFGVGWFALRWLVALVQRGGLYRFAPYCLLAGITAIVLSRTL
jgi:undecaprenyl-diphosphatase